MYVYEFMCSRVYGYVYIDVKYIYVYISIYIHIYQRYPGHLSAKRL
jgi:hypothetical protein